MGTWTTFDPAGGSCALPDPETVINPFAIASGEEFGAVAVNNHIILLPTAISSEETFGTPSMLPVLSPVAIATAEAFGTPELDFTFNLLPTAIASLEAFGTAAVGASLLSVGFENSAYPYTVTTGFDVHNGGPLGLSGSDYLTTSTDASHFETFADFNATQKTAIDLGTAELSVDIKMASGSDADNGGIVVLFYNSSGTVIGTAVNDFTNYSLIPGQDINITSWIPEGADKVGINWLNDRVTGTENSVYVGDFSALVVEHGTKSHTVIYSNGGTDVEGVQGATDDVSSWTNTTGTLFYDAENGLFNVSTIRGGSADADNLAYIEFAATSEELTAIAGATAILRLDCHLNNENNDDRVRLSIQGLNVSDTVVIELETSASPVDYNEKGKMFSLTSGVIPSTVTKFRVEVEMERIDGTANDSGAAYITARLEYTP